MKKRDELRVEVINDSDRKELKRFLAFPEEIYKHNKQWVEPIFKQQYYFFSRKNPFWRHAKKKLFVVKNTKSEEIIAHTAAIIDERFNEYIHAKKRIGYFGFFEAKNNPAAVRFLFRAVEDYMKEHNIKILRGPINGRISQKVGLLLKEFRLTPMPMMPYTLKYYLKLMRAAGFKKTKDLFAYSIDLREYNESRKKEEQAEDKEQQIVLRRFDRKRTDEEIRMMNALINKSMGETHHWQFSPSPLPEFKYLAEELVPVIDDNMIIIAEINKRPVGLIIAFPNFNTVLKYFHGRLGIINRIRYLFLMYKIKDAKLDIICVDPEHLHRGIGLTLIDELVRRLKKKEYKKIEYSWVAEDNKASIEMAEHLKGYLYKKYRVFEKEVS